MKKLAFLILNSLPILAFAQPVINAVPPPIGDSLSFYEGSYPQNNFPTSGFNNWDFSDVPFNNQATPLKILLPSNTPYSSEFPTATFCEKTYSYSSGVYYIYYQQNNDSLSILGLRLDSNPSYNVDYTDPIALYKFPVILNNPVIDVYTDNLGTQDSFMIKYVGWGNIKSPLGVSHTNVFLYEQYLFNSSTQAWELFSYHWVSVATLQDIYIAFVTYQESQFFENVNNTSGIASDELERKINCSLYPNPSNGSCFLDFNLPQRSNVSIQLISVDGKRNSTLLSESLPSGKHRIPILTSELSEGTYFVRIVIDNQVVVKTIEVVK